MNFGSIGGTIGEANPEMNRTLSDFFVTIIQIFSMISYAIQGLFGVK